MWRDNANAEEGDETDEPPMSPASPPGTTIFFKIKLQPKQLHIRPIRTPSQIMRPMPSADNFFARESTRPLPSPGKGATSVKRGKFPCAGKHATIAEPAKRCNQLRARESTRPLPSPRKGANSAKRGKTYTTCNFCQVRENEGKPSHDLYSHFITKVDMYRITLL